MSPAHEHAPPMHAVLQPRMTLPACLDWEDARAEKHEFVQGEVLVDPDTWRVEAFRRHAMGEWVLHDMSDGAPLVLPCIAASVPLAEVFDGGVEPPVAVPATGDAGGPAGMPS